MLTLMMLVVKVETSQGLNFALWPFKTAACCMDLLELLQSYHPPKPSLAVKARLTESWHSDWHSAPSLPDTQKVFIVIWNLCPAMCELSTFITITSISASALAPFASFAIAPFPLVSNLQAQIFRLHRCHNAPPKTAFLPEVYIVHPESKFDF